MLNTTQATELRDDKRRIILALKFRKEKTSSTVHLSTSTCDITGIDKT
jgi:hypothetical protein